MLRSRASAQTAGAAVLLLTVMLNASPAVAAEPASSAANPPSSLTATTQKDSGSASTDGLDPGTIGLCNSGFGDVSVKSWDIGIGHVDLFCGDSNSGYVHIREAHEAEWQALKDQIDALYGEPTAATWDDVMLGATDASLTAPGSGYPIDIGDGKLCYSSDYSFYGSDGALLKTIHPTIIVSQNNLKVITSVPTSSAVTSNCRSSS
jgi:hypothetical protein